MKAILQRAAFAAAIVGILAAGSAAFSADPKGAEPAMKAEAVPSAKASAAAPAGDMKKEGSNNDFTIDPVHSSIIFRVKHLDTTFVYGRFNNATGSVVWNDKHPDKSSIDVTVKVADVDTNSEKRDTHLKSADFFDAAKYPTITFKSKSIKELSEDKKSDKDKKKKKQKYEVTGDLTIKDVTKTITVEFEKTGEGDDPWGGHRIGGEADFEINKTEYNVKGIPGVGDKVDMTIALEASQKK
ncbi:hypothetical protein BH09SUM1_BH09SUM1_14390 [soil metagenome]